MKFCLKLGAALWAVLSITLLQGKPAVAGSWVQDEAGKDGFRLAGNGFSASLLLSEKDFEVVKIAAADLQDDLEKVTGLRPELETVSKSSVAGKVVIGTLGQSEVLAEALELTGLDVSDLEGAWESFIIAVAGEGESRTLVIAGSDRRGTAYGVYELSQAIGVSPWNWWADVPARKRESLHVEPGLRRFGPPSVKYRGIFINDEDWGLQPWAAQHFEPELGDIGPKTYERVFELLLRLKANTLWPAMHEVTKAFNLYPENKVVADRYAIVMASSHAEPMLRNNVTEWTHPKKHYNYATHPDLVKSYWEERLKVNGGYENVYTLGMRGIHDSGMTGGGSLEEKIALLDGILKDQRELLATHVNEDLESIPQVFTPYKEVLALYEGGLQVPEDVTIVWPDDNHGYLRRFPNEAERAREGGSGVYYHMSYLGAPLSYLWLDTVPLALVWEEMKRSYALGSRDYWIVNVGDIKPQERGMEFFLSMAWDIDRWGKDAQPAFLTQWAAREFGPENAERIQKLMSEYYALNFQRKPEHLQWWMPYKRVNTSPLTENELQERMERMLEMIEKSRQLEAELPETMQDAYFQLVGYPTQASAYANLRYFHLEQYHRLFHRDNALARKHGGIGRSADDKLAALTRRYNLEIADGKWKGMMAVEPADSMWRSYRTTPWMLPAEGMIEEASDIASAYEAIGFVGKQPSSVAAAEVVREAEDFNRRGGSGGAWEVVKELGWSGDAVTVFPETLPSVAFEALGEQTPWVEYDVELANSGEYRLFLNLLPTFPSESGGELQIAVSLNGEAPNLATIARKSKTPEWAKEVLSGTTGVEVALLVLEAGEHTIRVYMMDTGVVLDQFFLHQGELAPSFSGPSSLR